MILHQIFTSPFTSEELQRYSQSATSTDAVLLLQDGVYALNHPLLNQLLAQQNTIYLLENDVIARGLRFDTKQLQQLKIINDQQWLALCVECHKVISWT